MIKKLIVVAMLIATFGIGNVTYAQATSGSPGKWGKNHPRQHRRHRRHRRSENASFTHVKQKH
jgi:hypothetical protein